jgi:hypothetical protein
MLRTYKKNNTYGQLLYLNNICINNSYTVNVVRGATQKFGEFKQGAWTSCRLSINRQMWLAVCFVNLCVNSCEAERTYY